ncbi:MAG: hypothetical protein ACXWLC_09660 [Rhizomicrobium sp.]
MEKAPKSRAEIERLVLAELQTFGNCEGAAGISITGCDSFCDSRFDFGPNWTVAAFNSGTASDYECERALMNIVSRLQGFYKLVQKH